MPKSQNTMEPLAISPTRPASYVDHQLLDTPSERGHRIIRAEVCSISAPAKDLRRIAVQSPELMGFQLSGPDEFFGLLMPPTPGAQLHLPDHDGGINIRASVAAMPEGRRPNLRWYTVRTLDSERGILTFDVVTHGISSPDDEHIGPGLAWALSTRIGDDVALWTCQGLWHRKQASQTLIADPSAVPSLRAILEYTQTFAPEQLPEMHVTVLAESQHDLEPLLREHWEDKVGSLKVILRPATEFSGATLSYLRQLDEAKDPATHASYVWVAGEGDLCKEVRRHAIHSWGLKSDSVQWCPYWFIGRARP